VQQHKGSLLGILIMNTQFREEIDCHNKHNITEMKEHNSYLTTIYVPYQGFSSVELKSQLSTNVE